MSRRIATAWLIERRSLPSWALVRERPSPLGEVVMEKWKAEGMSTAITAMRRSEELSWAAVDLIVCSANRRPPAKKHLEGGRDQRRLQYNLHNDGNRRV
jgi:hypothetical protein